MGEISSANNNIEEEYYLAEILHYLISKEIVDKSMTRNYLIQVHNMNKFDCNHNSKG